MLSLRGLPLFGRFRHNKLLGFTQALTVPRKASLAAAASQVHRTIDGAPTSEQAHTSDATIHSTLIVLEKIRSQANNILITIEQPAHSVFRRHLTVKQLLYEGHWRLITSSHCSAATEQLDGIVTDDPWCEALFPRKNSIWLTSGVPQWADLPQCNQNCRMLIPGTTVHRLLICRPAKQPLRKGQRVLTSAEAKGRIPLGVLQQIWELHQQWIQYNDGAHTHCITCGSDLQEKENQLFLCEQEGCKHVQHGQCHENQMGKLDVSTEKHTTKVGAYGWEQSEPFTCSECVLRQSVESGSHGWQAGYAQN